MKLELDPQRKLALTSDETTAKIRAALTQFYQGNSPSKAQLERAQHEYLAYRSELNAPRPAWWGWAQGLSVWSDEEKRRYAWINSPDWPANPPRRVGRIGAFSTYNVLGESTEAPSKAPAIALGVLGLGAIGAAIYFSFQNKSGAGTTPAAAPSPKPTPAPAPTPAKASAPKPAPVATAPVSARPSGQYGSSGFKIGQHVMAVWTDGNWYGGRVNGVNSSGHVEVVWDDGGVPLWVPASQVRTGGAPAAVAANPLAPQASVDPRTQAMADCFSKGGNQLDQDGNCYNGDTKIG